MSSIISQIVNPLEDYTADVATTLIMGIGYHLFKKLKNNDDWSDEKQKTNELKNKIIHALQKWEYASTIDEYNLIIKSNHDNSDPLEILKQMTEKGIEATIETYNALLLNCYFDSNEKAANVLKEEMFDISGPVAPNNYTLNILIKGLSFKYINLLKREAENNKNFNPSELQNNFDEELVEIIQSLEQKNIFMDVFAQNTILDALVETNRLDDAWCQYTNMKSIFQADTFTYLTILKGIKKSTELTSEWLERAFGIINEACIGNKMDENFYNLLLDSCVKFNKIDKAELLYKEMKSTLSNGIPMGSSEFTSSIMIKAYGRVYKLAKAFDIFNSIKETSIPNITTYSTIINTCIRCKALDKAEELFTEMKLNKVKPNLYVYTILLTGYRQQKKIEKVLELYQEIKDNKEEPIVEPNLTFYNSILECCVDTQKYEIMSQIYDDLKNAESHIVPDMTTYSILIKGFAKSGNNEKVNDIYEYLSEREDFKLDEFVYNSMFDCLVKKGDHVNCQKIIADMKKNNLKLGVASYGQLIKIFCNANNFNKAFEVFEDCIKSDIKPNVIMYQMLIKCQIKNSFIDRAITLFNSMEVNGVKPDIPIYELMIKACVKNDRELEAMELTIKCTKTGMKLENYIYNQIIDTIIQTRFLRLHEKHDGLIKLYTEIKIKQFELEIEHRTLQKLTTFIYKNELNIVEKKKKQQNCSHPQIKPSDNQSISSGERSIYDVPVATECATPRNNNHKQDFNKTQPRDYNKKDNYYADKYHQQKTYGELQNQYEYKGGEGDYYCQTEGNDYNNGAYTSRTKGNQYQQRDFQDKYQSQTPRAGNNHKSNYNSENQNKKGTQQKKFNEKQQDSRHKGAFQFGDLNGESLYSKTNKKKR